MTKSKPNLMRRPDSCFIYRRCIAYLTRKPQSLSVIFRLLLLFELGDTPG